MLFQVPALLAELCEQCPSTGQAKGKEEGGEERGEGFVWRGVYLERLVIALAR